jgi:hypothetical protein
MQDVTIASPALISRAEAQLLTDTADLLHTIESRAAKASWGRPTTTDSDGPTAYAYGRSAEACSRAARAIENALITLSVWGDAAAADEALRDDDDEDPRTLESDEPPYGAFPEER